MPGGKMDAFRGFADEKAVGEGTVDDTMGKDAAREEDSGSDQNSKQTPRKKIKFNPKPLRDHGHMRHGPVQGADVGEESGALVCNFVWSFSRDGGRRLGGLMVAVPQYGASHLAAFLKSKLADARAARGGDGLEEGEYVAEEGDRQATKEDFVKLDIDPAAVERFNDALRDRNIDSMQIANPDGSVKFIIRAQDEDEVNRALDDIINVPDKQLDERHAVAQQARSFAYDAPSGRDARDAPSERSARASGNSYDAPGDLVSDDAHGAQSVARPELAALGASTLDMDVVAALGMLAQEEPRLDDRINEGKKDAAQRTAERRQDRDSVRDKAREPAQRDLSRQHDRGVRPDR